MSSTVMSGPPALTLTMSPRLKIVGQVDRGHPALTDLTLDAVAAFEGCVQAGDGVRAVHALKMRFSPADREQVPLWTTASLCRR